MSARGAPRLPWLRLETLPTCFALEDAAVDALADDRAAALVTPSLPSRNSCRKCCKRVSTPAATSRSDLPMLPNGAFARLRCTLSTSEYNSRACWYSPWASARRALERRAVTRRKASTPEHAGASSC